MDILYTCMFLIFLNEKSYVNTVVKTQMVCVCVILGFIMKSFCVIILYSLKIYECLLCVRQMCQLLKIQH